MKQPQLSKIMGIIAICTGWVIPLIGVTCAIVGFSVRKDENHRDRDIMLNIVGIIVSIMAWLLYTSLYL